MIYYGIWCELLNTSDIGKVLELLFGDMSKGECYFDMLQPIDIYYESLENKWYGIEEAKERIEAITDNILSMRMRVYFEREALPLYCFASYDSAYFTFICHSDQEYLHALGKLQLSQQYFICIEPLGQLKKEKVDGIVK